MPDAVRSRPIQASSSELHPGLQIHGKDPDALADARFETEKSALELKTIFK